MVKASNKGKHAIQNLSCNSLPYKHHKEQLWDYHYSIQSGRWRKCNDIICENRLTSWELPEEVDHPEQLVYCNQQQPADRITAEETREILNKDKETTSQTSTPEPGPQTPKTVMTMTMTQQQAVDTLL